MHSYIVDSDHDKRETHLKGFKHTGGSCFRCRFAPSSSASHCAVIVHTHDKVINVSLFEGNGHSAHGCVTVEPGLYFVVAFGYANNTILGRPYVAGRMHLDRAQGTVCIPALSDKYYVTCVFYSITEESDNDNIPIEGLTI